MATLNYSLFGNPGRAARGGWWPRASRDIYFNYIYVYTDRFVNIAARQMLSD